MTAVTWPWPDWQCFDASGSDPEKLKQVLEQDADDLPGKGRPLVCSRCGHAISTEAQRIDIAGAHSHTCTNPHGIVYRIGCFSAAPGCSEVGPVVREFSWFTGYRWQVAVCGNCQEHLGWYFRGEQPFYGLIHDRLSAADN